MTSAGQSHSDYALVRGLIHARAGRRPFARMPTLQDEKLLSTLVAGAAWAGFALLSIEADDGTELLVATRGAETIRFENREQVGAWLNSLVASSSAARCNAVGLR